MCYQVKLKKSEAAATSSNEKPADGPAQVDFRDILRKKKESN